MVSYVALWAIAIAIAVPGLLFAAFIRPTNAMRQVPPVWRAAPLVVLSSLGLVLVFTPPGWHAVIVQLGLLSIQFLGMYNARFVRLPKRPLSILGLNERDKP